MKNKAAPTTYSQTEISASLNNAYLAASNPHVKRKPTEQRMRNIRAYVEALSNIMLSDVDAEYLTAEELVMIFSGSALFVHSVRVAKTTRLPAFQDFSKRVLDDEIVNEILGEELSGNSTKD